MSAVEELKLRLTETFAVNDATQRSADALKHH